MNWTKCWLINFFYGGGGSVTQEATQDRYPRRHSRPLPKTDCSSYYPAEWGHRRRASSSFHFRVFYACCCTWGGEINAPAWQMVGGAYSDRGALGACERRAHRIRRGRCDVAGASGPRRGA